MFETRRPLRWRGVCICTYLKYLSAQCAIQPFRSFRISSGDSGFFLEGVWGHWSEQGRCHLPFTRMLQRSTQSVLEDLGADVTPVPPGQCYNVAL